MDNIYILANLSKLVKALQLGYSSPMKTIKDFTYSLLLLIILVAALAGLKFIDIQTGFFSTAARAVYKFLIG